MGGSPATRKSVFGSASRRLTPASNAASSGSSRCHQSRKPIMSRATSAASSSVARRTTALSDTPCGPPARSSDGMAAIRPPITEFTLRVNILPPMALIEVPSGLEGVIAFDTQIAEPDKEGGALRYRGVDIEELVGNVPYEKV